MRSGDPASASSIAHHFASSYSLSFFYFDERKMPVSAGDSVIVFYKNPLAERDTETIDVRIPCSFHNSVRHRINRKWRASSKISTAVAARICSVRSGFGSEFLGNKNFVQWPAQHSGTRKLGGVKNKF